MWDQVRKPIRNVAIRGVIALIAASLFAATASQQVLPLTKQRAYNVMQVAQIEEAPSTIGISDSDVFWAGSLAEINERLDLMESLGVSNIRILVPWANMQPLHPDTPFGLGGIRWEQLDLVVNAAAARGMGILGVLNSTPVWASANLPINGTPTDFNRFADFAKAVALRYGEKISAYEVWNEPNSVQFWNSLNPTTYTEMLKVTYTALKQAAAQLGTEITVVGGVVGAGMSISGLTMNPVDFVRKMLEAGANGYFDALSFHSYNMTWKFSQTQGNAWQDAPLTQLNKIRELLDAALAPGQEQIKIWMTEYGMPTNVMTDAKQAEFIKDMLETWQTIAGAGPVFLYTIKDWLNGDANNNEAHFGIFRPDGTMKPVGQIIKDLIELLTDPQENPGDPGPGQGPGAGAGASNPIAAFMKAISKAVSGMFSAFNVFPNLVSAFSSALNNFIGGLFGKKPKTVAAAGARMAGAGALADEAPESVTDGSAKDADTAGVELETVTEASGSVGSVTEVKSVQQVQGGVTEAVREPVAEEAPVVDEVPVDEVPVDEVTDEVVENVTEEEAPAEEATEATDEVAVPVTETESDVTEKESEKVTDESAEADTVAVDTKDATSIADQKRELASDSTETASPEVRETAGPSLKGRQELSSRSPKGLRKSVRAEVSSSQESRTSAGQNAGTGSDSGSDSGNDD